MTTYRLLIAIKHALPNWPFVDFMKKETKKPEPNDPAVAI
jgi:hypothetical protein